MKIRIPILVLVFLIGLKSHSQDVNFSQAYANGIWLNPSLTGVDENPKLSFAYRTQWASSAAKYTTHATSFENSLPGKNSSYGIQFLSDVSGDNILKTQTGNLFYSYKIKLNRKWQIRAGIQAGINQKSLNIDNLIFEDQINDRQGVVRATDEILQNQNLYFYDFGTGLTLMSNKYYAGLSVHHLNKPNTNFTKDGSRNLPIRISSQMGAKFEYKKLKLNKAFYSPNIIIQSQGGNQRIQIGNYLKYNTLTFGTWYDLNDAVILTLGIELDDLKVGYSADISAREFGGTFAHEVSISYLIKRKNKTKRVSVREKVFCPSF